MSKAMPTPLERQAGRMLVVSRTTLWLAAVEFLAIGLSLCLVSAVVESPRQALEALALAAPMSAVQSWFYLHVMRKSVRRAPLAPARPLRPSSYYPTRAVWSGAAIAATDVLIALAYNRWLSTDDRHGFAFLGSLQISFGVACLFTGSWLSRWEQAHHQTLLHESRIVSFRTPPSFLTGCSEKAECP